MYKQINVKVHFGAKGDGVTDDTAAIQAAINALPASGGEVYIPSGEYNISSAIVLGTGQKLIGESTNTSRIIQQSSNVAIIAITDAATNYNWAITDLHLEYETQQTAANTSAFGIQLATSNVISYLGEVVRVRIVGAYQGVVLPNLTGCSAFLVSFRDVHVRAAVSYGFYLYGASSGSRTNLVLERCYVEQVVGSEISTSRGIHIANCDGFRIDNCGCDHIQDWLAVYILNSNGSIGTVWAESCDISVSSGQKILFWFVNSSIDISNIYSAYNTVTLTGSGDFSLVRLSGGSNVRLGVLTDKGTELTDTSSAGYHTVEVSSSDVMSVDTFNYVAGSSAAPNADLVDTGTVKYLRSFDGNIRAAGRFGVIELSGSGAPVSGSWSVGDKIWNTIPSASGFIGWVCTTSGAPGTWKTFGPITA